MQTKESKTNKENTIIKKQLDKLIDIRINAKKNISRSKSEKEKNDSNVELFATDCIKELEPIRIKSLLGVDQFENTGNVIDIIKDIYPHIKDDVSLFKGTKVFNEQTEPHEFLG